MSLHGVCGVNKQNVNDDVDQFDAPAVKISSSQRIRCVYPTSDTTLIIGIITLFYFTIVIHSRVEVFNMR